MNIVLVIVYIGQSYTERHGILPYSSHGNLLLQSLGLCIADKCGKPKIFTCKLLNTVTRRLCIVPQNGSGAHPASYPMSTRGSFPGGEAAGA
jgi:hypothetical protein